MHLSTFSDLGPYQIICWKIHSKSQGSPMWCPSAPGHPQKPTRFSAGIGVAKRHSHQISSIHCRFALWEVLPQTKYCCSLKVTIFVSKKISGWLHYCPWACCKNDISMISVFTLQNMLIVNTTIIKGKLSNVFISEACIKLVALCINRHVWSSSQLQEGWWSLL